MSPARTSMKRRAALACGKPVMVVFAAADRAPVPSKAIHVRLPTTAKVLRDDQIPPLKQPIRLAHFQYREHASDHEKPILLIILYGFSADERRVGDRGNRHGVLDCRKPKHSDIYRIV